MFCSVCKRNPRWKCTAVSQTCRLVRLEKFEVASWAFFSCSYWWRMCEKLKLKEIIPKDSTKTTNLSCNPAIVWELQSCLTLVTPMTPWLPQSRRSRYHCQQNAFAIKLNQLLHKKIQILPSWTPCSVRAKFGQHPCIISPVCRYNRCPSGLSICSTSVARPPNSRFARWRVDCTDVFGIRLGKVRLHQCTSGQLS